MISDGVSNKNEHGEVPLAVYRVFLQHEGHLISEAVLAEAIASRPTEKFSTPLSGARPTLWETLVHKYTI